MRVDLRRHARRPRRPRRSTTCAASRPSCSSGSAPATPTCSTRSATPATLPEGDALDERDRRVQGRRSSAAARRRGRRRPPRRRRDRRAASRTAATAVGRHGWRSGADPPPTDQERSSRRRRSRARMELIAASRIVKAQARGARRPALQRADHRGDPRPRRGRWRDRQPAARARGPRSARVAHIVITADRGLCGALQLERASAPPSASHRRATRRRARLLARHRRPEGRELLPLPRLRHRRRVQRLHRPARPTRTPAAIGQAVDARRSWPARSTWSSSSTPASSRPASRRS